MSKEKIQIYDNIKSITNYDKLLYQEVLEDLFPKENQIIISYYADIEDKFQLEIRQFQELDNLSFINRIIVNQDKFIVVPELHEDEYDNSKVVRPNIIVQGINRNYPKGRDLVIKEYKNWKYIFSEKALSDPKLLQKKLKMLYYINRFISQHPPANQSYSKIENVKFPVLKYYPLDQFNIPINPEYEKQVNKILYPFINTQVDFSDSLKLQHQLSGLGLESVFYYMIDSDLINVKKNTKSIATELQRGYFIQEQFSEVLLERSEMIRIKQIIEKEINNPKEYLEIINKFNVNNMNELKKYLPKPKFQKLKQLVQPRLIIDSRMCKAHTNLLQELIKLRNNSYPDIKTAKQILDELQKMSTKSSNNQFECNTCHQVILCDHTVHTINTIYETNKNIRSVNLNEFRGETDGNITYCRYCKEKLLVNQLNVIMENKNFEDIQRTREIQASGKTDLSIFGSFMYRGVRMGVSEFRFKYTFSESNLIKSINNLIGPYVYDYIVKRKIVPDNIPYHATMFGYIWTIVYIMFIYLKDPNIYIPKQNIKTRKEYGTYFKKLIMKKFNNQIDKKKTELALQQAFINLGSEYKVEINYVTGKYNTLIIANRMLYIMLYRLYTFENKIIRTVDKSPYMFLPEIINPEKYKNINEVNFWIKPTIRPKEKLNIAMFDYLIDTSKKANKVYDIDFPYELPDATNLENLKFDKTVENEILEYDKKSNFRKFFDRYYPQLVTPAVGRFKDSFPAYYIYDESGNIIKWMPTLVTKKQIKNKITNHGNFVNEQKEITFTHEKLDLFKMEEPTRPNIQKLIDTRNKKLNYKIKSWKLLKPLKPPKFELNPDYKFIFKEKSLGIVKKINQQKYNINIFRNLGNSEGHKIIELKNDQISNPNFLDNDIRISKIKSYIEQLIINFSSLINNPSLMENSLLLEKLGKTPADIDKLKKINLSTINDDNYWSKLSEISNWKPQDQYGWLKMFLTEAINKILTSYPDIGKMFLEIYLDDIFRQEKLISESDNVDIAFEKIDDLDGINYEGPFNEKEADEEAYLDDVDFVEDDEDNINYGD